MMHYLGSIPALQDIQAVGIPDAALHKERDNLTVQIEKMVISIVLISL